MLAVDEEHSECGNKCRVNVSVSIFLLGGSVGPGGDVLHCQQWQQNIRLRLGLEKLKLSFIDDLAS